MINFDNKNSRKVKPFFFECQVVIELGFMQPSFCRFVYNYQFQVSCEDTFTREIWEWVLARALCDVKSDCDMKQSIYSFSRNRPVVYFVREEKSLVMSEKVIAVITSVAVFVLLSNVMLETKQGSKWIS